MKHNFITCGEAAELIRKTAAASAENQKWELIDAAYKMGYKAALNDIKTQNKSK